MGQTRKTRKTRKNKSGGRCNPNARGGKNTRHHKKQGKSEKRRVSGKKTTRHNKRGKSGGAVGTTGRFYYAAGKMGSDKTAQPLEMFGQDVDDAVTGKIYMSSTAPTLNFQVADLTDKNDNWSSPVTPRSQ